MIEFDVRLTADGEPVVLHDARTGRTAKENLPVASTPAARIRKVLLKNGEPVPFLADVLELLRGRIPVNIHVKTTGGTAAVCRTLSNAGYDGKVVLSSGLREECLEARTLRPDLPCGLVTGRPSASDIAFCLRHSLRSIHPDHRRLTLRVRKVKTRGSC
jgi:glycerophosphoryl diester phosphodiesterase